VKSVTNANNCAVIEQNLIMGAFWTVIKDQAWLISGDQVRLDEVSEGKCAIVEREQNRFG